MLRRAMATAVPGVRRRGLNEFFEVVSREGAAHDPAGRAWRTAELRRKSQEDLHKLWYVLWKERNMLYTEREYARSKKMPFQNPARVKKVRKSMARLKFVWDERLKAYYQLKAEAAQAEASAQAQVKKQERLERFVQKRNAWLKGNDA